MRSSSPKRRWPGLGARRVHPPQKAYGLLSRSFGLVAAGWLLLAAGLGDAMAARSPRPAAPVEPPAASAAVSDPPAQTVELSLPFDGVWGVVQGFDSGKTHVGYAAFALDFVPAQKIDPHAPKRKPKRLSEFPCYGRPLVAPADGKVVWAHDGAPDARPWSKVPYDPGNFVIIEHGDSQYTELRHLKAGSIKVLVGQHVRRGQRIGECGNSGTATTPHLHLGLLASANPIATRPMRFSQYEVLDAEGRWQPGNGALRQGELVRSVRPKDPD